MRVFESDYLTHVGTHDGTRRSGCFDAAVFAFEPILSDAHGAVECGNRHILFCKAGTGTAPTLSMP